MLSFPDRLIFDTVNLSNGITVYLYPYNVPFTESVIMFPYGHRHSTGSIIPGTFHFLEHMIFRRSEKFPELFSLEKKVKMKGAYFNAYTGETTTRYVLNTTTKNFTEDFSDFIDHLTSVTFHQDDFNKERGVIRNERTRYEKYFPGHNEISKYLLTKWVQKETSTLDEQLGFDSSLNKMTPQYLEEVYNNYYWTKDTIVLIGGTFDREAVIKKLEAIQTKESFKQEKRKEIIRWENKTYREVVFDSAKRPEYYYGLVLPINTPEEATILSFIANIATNAASGVIYDWLRHDLNESYSIGSSISRYDEAMYFSLYIPLNTTKHIETIRKELVPRIREALGDQERINRELDRIDAKDAFSYQKLGNIMDSAIGALKSDGKIFTETEIDARWSACRDQKRVLDFFDTYFRTEYSGEILVMPKKYTRFEDALVKFAKKYILRTE